MPLQIARIYRKEDNTMMAQSQTILDLFIDDLPTFTALFPFLNEDTATALQASIDTADAIAPDSQVTNLLKILTQDVNAQVVLGRNALSQLNHFAVFTYPNSKAMQRAFGQDEWAKAYNDQENMAEALEQAYTIAASAPFAADLLAKGYTAAMTTNLQTISNNIKAKNSLQEKAKKLRAVSTENRIQAYNAVWAQVKDISFASKEVFKDSPAKIKAYLLYPDNTDTTTVDITVNIIGESTPLVNASVKIIGSELAPQTTSETGQVSFASVDIEEFISLEITSEGATVTIIPDLSITPGTTNTFTVEANE